MRVSFIGSGNAATVLARKMLHGGHIIHQVFSRNPVNARKLADELTASAIDSINDLDDEADIFIVSVSDSSLQDIRNWMKPVSKLIVHTAGSVPMDILKDISANYGVLYPLQTLRRETSELPHVPLLIDANNPWNLTKLSGFARSFGESVHTASDDERRKLHLSAVITNNFANYLFTLTEQYCSEEGVDFKLLLPLLEETIKRLQYNSAVHVQTGPAARRDKSTLDRHRVMLQEHRELLDVYNFFSERIMNFTSA